MPSTLHSTLPVSEPASSPRPRPAPTASATPAAATPAPLVGRDVLVTLSRAINSDLDLRRVLQTVTDVGTQLSGAQFGAFFYNGLDAKGELYQLHVLSGAGLETFAAMPAPRITALFQPTFDGHATVRIGDVREDPRFSGMPAGHLPVRSYLATPVVSRTGEVIGSLLFGHCDPDVFDDASEQTVLLIAAQAAVAVENARLYSAEQRARRRAETLLERMALLQSLTTRLGPELTAEGALEAVSETIAAPMGVRRVGLYLREQGGFRSIDPAQTSGSASGPVRGPVLTWLPDTTPNPVSDAVERREPVEIPDARALAERYPDLPFLDELTGTGEAAAGASIVLPLPARRCRAGRAELRVAAGVPRRAGRHRDAGCRRGPGRRRRRAVAAVRGRTGRAPAAGREHPVRARRLADPAALAAAPRAGRRRGHLGRGPLPARLGRRTGRRRLVRRRGHRQRRQRRHRRRHGPQHRRRRAHGSAAHRPARLPVRGSPGRRRRRPRQPVDQGSRPARHRHLLRGADRPRSRPDAHRPRRAPRPAARARRR